MNLAQGVALTGYGGLWPLIPAWYLWLAPQPGLAKPLVLVAVLLVPLLFPLPGLVRGRSYTYAWSSFLALFYFIHGTIEAWSVPAARTLAVAEIALALLWFGGALAFVRSHRPSLN